MVQREMENRPILPSNYRNRRLVLGLRLVMRRLPGLACRDQLATALGHDLRVMPLRLGLRRDAPDATVQAHIHVA